MSDRIILSSSFVSVSKPGVDVNAPPAISYDYLALDSRLTNLRAQIIATVPSYVFGNKVFYGQTFANAPAVDVFFYNNFVSSGTYAGVVRYGVYKDNGSTSYDRSSYFIVHERDGFTITDRAVNTRAAPFTGSWILYYVAWNIR